MSYFQFDWNSVHTNGWHSHQSFEWAILNNSRKTERKKKMYIKSNKVTNIESRVIIAPLVNANKSHRSKRKKISSEWRLRIRLFKNCCTFGKPKKFAKWRTYIFVWKRESHLPSLDFFEGHQILIKVIICWPWTNETESKEWEFIHKPGHLNNNFACINSSVAFKSKTHTQTK